jgi:CHAT domain-containing protein
MPWLALEPVRAVPTVVAPSARSWLAARAHQRRPGLLLAAGPDLPGAATEITALAAEVPGAAVLDPAHATVAGVLSGMATNGVAHLAAHGTFRSDNPQFSSLHLADGELTVYDLETLPRTPEIVVLSACDAAATGVHAGDELLGLSAAVLALGTRSLVAPVLPVPDDATAPLMVALQRTLASGAEAPEALRDAVASTERDDHAGFATARSFITWGA